MISFKQNDSMILYVEWIVKRYPVRRVASLSPIPIIFFKVSELPLIAMKDIMKSFALLQSWCLMPQTFLPKCRPAPKCSKVWLHWMLLKSRFSSQISGLIFRNTVQSVSLIDLPTSVCLLSNSQKERQLFRSEMCSESLHLVRVLKECTLRKKYIYIQLSLSMPPLRDIARMNNYVFIFRYLHIVLFWKDINLLLDLNNMRGLRRLGLGRKCKNCCLHCPVVDLAWKLMSVEISISLFQAVSGVRMMLGLG